MNDESYYLNEECENTRSKLCYLRKRYPIKCSNSYEECLSIKKCIFMKPLHSTIRGTAQCISLIEQHASLLKKISPTHSEKKKIVNIRDLHMKIENLTSLLNQMKILKLK